MSDIEQSLDFGTIAGAMEVSGCVGRLAGGSRGILGLGDVCACTCGCECGSLRSLAMSDQK